MPDNESRYNGNGALVAAGVATLFAGIVMISLGAPNTYVVLKPRRWRRGRWRRWH
jgi:hypothetical protein